MCDTVITYVYETFRPASRQRLDDCSPEIGIPSFLPNDEQSTLVQPQRYYFVTMESCSPS